MLARIVMVTAIASWVLLFGAPTNALACHKGDPRVPHGNQTSCDGGGDLTNLVLVDGNGTVVGPVSTLIVGDPFPVIVFTPDQRPFRLFLRLREIISGGGYAPFGSVVWYEELGCPDTGATYLLPEQVVPNIFHESAIVNDGAGGLVPWVGTSFELLNPGMLSRKNNGICTDLPIPETAGFFPAEQLTDESGFLVEDIRDLYPPPLRFEAQ